jgi:hypothetical protein
LFVTIDRKFAVQGCVVGVLVLVAVLLVGANPEVSAAGDTTPWVVRKITPPGWLVDPLAGFRPRQRVPGDAGPRRSVLQVLSHTADPVGIEALICPAPTLERGVR